MKLLLVLALLVAGAIAAKPSPSPAPSSAASPSPSSSASPNPWTLKTDELNANMATGAFSAPHHVAMTRTDGSTVDADRATGNFKKHQATLYGDVVVHDASGTFGLQSAQNGQQRGPATLAADEVAIDEDAKQYEALGHVHFTQGDTTVDAQRGHLDDSTHLLDLNGHVHIVQGDRTLDADHATYNTQSGAGTADNNVTVIFPGITPTIATPKPIKIGGPKIP